MDSTSKIELRVNCENEQPHVVRGISKNEQRTVLEILLENNIEIDHSCGGNGTCGTCRYYLTGSQESMSERTSLELDMAQDRSFKGNERLACQTRILESCEITVG
jgi:2Fe-2S ferredoxin